MQPWISQSPAYLERWIDEQGIDRSSVERVREGLDIAIRDEVLQHTTGGQQPNLFIPGLAALPWWESDRFPWIAGLEAATADITAEFENLGGLRGKRTVNGNPTELADEGRWSAHYLYYTAKAYPKNVKACPRTIAALEPIPGALGCGMTYFSVLDPHTHIAAHTGYTNAHLRCHLGLVTPDGPRIRVGAGSREWERGRAFVFDDSYEHEVWNDTDSGRAVLLFDLWHPDLSEVEVRAITHLMDVSRKLIYRSFWSKEFVSA
ncbi:aspartyl/asparaginyl beta-hydroxylase domain-containing protein [Streptomyces brevispora]|uniref:aspartyl/asparaginyl beta-hydroxylase domain-containing protein n=1 Tax=Streptomyces brevispora TaxID=887462 RepID=UPI002E32FA72|nr:aspartyl/asparaginyl beta-hydroxylase domain-containing protein [Streptomyces brevispora]